MDALAKFVQQYPKAEDTPEALMHLGNGREFGKEEQAKGWYQQLVNNFPQHPLAAKARGAIRRLDSVGRPMELAGPTLAGGQPYDIKGSRGKVVAVYYWMSECEACVRDFAGLKELQSKYAAKGLEIVTVNLDEKQEDASKFLASHPLAVTHLFQATEQGKGLNSPLALHYGITTMPHIFLVGKDGNVVNRTLQINDLEDAVRKAQ
jgi:thiol-disulfide isomerase/thioredoxin